MPGSLIWVSGASSGIGRAVANAVPWPDSRVIGISRGAPVGIDHLEADLSEPASWAIVGSSFAKELAGFEGERAVLVHAAGTLDPIGFAGEVDGDVYAANVILNSAAPQVLGHLFLEALAGAGAGCAGHLVMLTSGAARSVYPGWSSYGAGKAAVDHWVRKVGAEQKLRGGAQVVSIAPGTVDTGMQAQLRVTSEVDFPHRQKFLDLHAAGNLTHPDEVARGIWSQVTGGLETGSVVDLRQVATG